MDLLATEGTEGQVRSSPVLLLGYLGLCQEHPRGQELAGDLATRDIQEQLVKASSGFDIPPFESFMDFKTWEEVEPPKYTIYNFPPRET